MHYKQVLLQQYFQGTFLYITHLIKINYWRSILKSNHSFNVPHFNMSSTSGTRTLITFKSMSYCMNRLMLSDASFTAIAVNCSFLPSYASWLLSNFKSNTFYRWLPEVFSVQARISANSLKAKGFLGKLWKLFNYFLLFLWSSITRLRYAGSILFRLLCMQKVN